MPQPSITEICLKSTCLKFHFNFPGANELTFLQTCDLPVQLLSDFYSSLSIIYSSLYFYTTFITSESTCQKRDGIGRMLTASTLLQSLPSISLAPGDDILCHKMWSILVQVMAWYSQAHWSHINCIVNEVLLHLPKGNYTENAKTSITKTCLKITSLIL